MALENFRGSFGRTHLTVFPRELSRLSVVFVRWLCAPRKHDGSDEGRLFFLSAGTSVCASSLFPLFHLHLLVHLDLSSSSSSPSPASSSILFVEFFPPVLGLSQLNGSSHLHSPLCFSIRFSLLLFFFFFPCFFFDLLLFFYFPSRSPGGNKPKFSVNAGVGRPGCSSSTRKGGESPADLWRGLVTPKEPRDDFFSRRPQLVREGFVVKRDTRFERGAIRCICRVFLERGRVAVRGSLAWRARPNRPRRGGHW